jgi:hypothetical protein
MKISSVLSVGAEVAFPPASASLIWAGQADCQSAAGYQPNAANFLSQRPRSEESESLKQIAWNLF